MPDMDRTIAGLRCRDVLGLLPDYMEGELDEETVDRVHEHLGGCDDCEKFGGEYESFVSRLRAQLPPAGSGDRNALRRLQKKMAEVWR